jgi:hypothetical protein
MAQYCTLRDVKDALNLTGETADDLLMGFIQAVATEIDNHCNRTFAAASATKYYDGVADNLIIDDLVTVTSIKLDTDGNGTWETTLAATDYVLCPYNTTPKWLVKLSENSTQSDFANGILQGVQIAGSFGYGATVPEPVKQAALMQVCRLYRLSQAGFGTEVGTPDIGTSTVFQGLSSDAKRMLAPYVRPYA